MIAKARDTHDDFDTLLASAKGIVERIGLAQLPYFDKSHERAEYLIASTDIAEFCGLVDDLTAEGTL